jgi:hypothetical protein
MHGRPMLWAHDMSCELTRARTRDHVRAGRGGDSGNSVKQQTAMDAMHMLILPQFHLTHH